MPDDEIGAMPLSGHRVRSLTALERRFITEAKMFGRNEENLLPAWLRPTRGEHRWQMAVAAVAAIGLQLSLPARLTLRPHLLMPCVEGALLIALIVASPARIERHSKPLRATLLALLAAISIDNGWSAALLVHVIVAGHADSAGRLLLEGVSIWLTNVIVFGLWYWEFDRGGPVARAHGEGKFPDLLFPQMQQPDIAPPSWEPMFFDYLYTSFTNATAFSPTDTLPLSRWAKALFLVQSAISLVTVALVISRAVNVFKDSSGS